MAVGTSGIFEGLKVFDMSWVGVGPITAKYLADHGATVVRVDSSVHPDVLRLAPPFKDGVPGINRSQFYADYNSSKYGLGLNLAHPKGQQLALELAAWADVVLESFTPPVKKKFGLDYENIKKVNPDVIMFSTCMQGQTGPRSSYPGFGTLMAPICGFYHLTGYPDTGPTPPYGAYTDFICQRFAISFILAALDHHARTGEGQYIDASQLEISLNFLAPVLLDAEVNGRIMGRMGNKSPYAAPHDNYPCKEDDTWCAIAVETEEQWEALKRKMGNPSWAEDPKFSTLMGRKAHEEELDAHLREWTRQFDAYHLMYYLQPEVPAGVVQSVHQLIFEDAQISHLEYFTWLEHPEMGSSPYTGIEFALSDTPVGLRWAAPKVGEHSEFVLREILGKTDDEIADLLGELVVEIT